MTHYDPDTFDPCSEDGTSGGCSTCPMAAECIPSGLLADLEDLFSDPEEEAYRREVSGS